MISVQFSCNQKSVTRTAGNGTPITYTLQDGIVLKRVVGGNEEVVAQVSPFIHSGDDCIYFLECVNYPGYPVTGTLSI